MAARIVAATFRDLSYIAANIRPEDRAEAEAQFGQIHYLDMAAAHLRDHAYVALIDGNPEAAFGAARACGDHLWTAWSWGTKRMRRAVPIIVRFVRGQLTADVIAAGAQRMEARALASHFTAHRWLEAMGARRRCELPCYGRNGEDFILYDWTRDDVLLPAKDAEAGTSASYADA